MSKRKITTEEIELLKPFTKKRKISLWGQVVDTAFEPVLLDTVFGDGLKLMSFRTINNRPRYYLVLVDSKTPINSSDCDAIYDFFEDTCGEFPDCIYIAIEEEYGNCRDMDNGSWCERGEAPCEKYNQGQDCSYCDDERFCEWTKWPALDEDCGCGWDEEAIYVNGKWVTV